VLSFTLGALGEGENPKATAVTREAEEDWGESSKLLEATLAEEKETDEALTELAESSVNQHAEAA
jgi:ferritin-like metal-binding protein YciE